MKENFSEGFVANLSLPYLLSPLQVNLSFPVDNTPTRISVPASGSFVKPAPKTKGLTWFREEGFSLNSPR